MSIYCIDCWKEILYCRKEKKPLLHNNRICLNCRAKFCEDAGANIHKGKRKSKRGLREFLKYSNFDEKFFKCNRCLGYYRKVAWPLHKRYCGGKKNIGK